MRTVKAFSLPNDWEEDWIPEDVLKELRKPVYAVEVGRGEVADLAEDVADEVAENTGATVLRVGQALYTLSKKAAAAAEDVLRDPDKYWEDGGEEGEADWEWNGAG